MLNMTRYGDKEMYCDTCWHCVSHQVSVDVLLRLQVGHAFRDVFTHLEELDRGRVLLQALPEVRQQAAIGKELGHYINGPLFGAHAVQLDQVLVAKLPGLSKKETEVMSYRSFSTKSSLSFPIYQLRLNSDSFCFAHIMILASSMKSSSDMEPSLIILMATSCWPCHFPYFTTPN